MKQNSGKKILLVVDMQNDFIDGSLGTAQARKILPRVAEKIVQRKAEGYEVIFTMDTHAEDYALTQEGKKLPVVHCVKGTRGWRLNDSVAPLSSGCEIFEKQTFGSAALFTSLAARNPERIEIVGLCTDICVISNAIGLKTFLPQTPICVAADCCAGATPEGHLHALSAMRACQIDII